MPGQLNADLARVIKNIARAETTRHVLGGAIAICKKRIAFYTGLIAEVQPSYDAAQAQFTRSTLRAAELQRQIKARKPKRS